MWWIVGGFAIFALLVGGVGVWFLAPTMRTFHGPDFEPTSADDASVLRAQQSGMVDGGD
ncbi:MAG: hypothetical protein ACRDPG_11465 [Nocardioidaceae bacterium]